MPLSIFRIRTLAGANVVGLLLGASIFADFFLLTLYVQNVLGYSPLKTGMTFLATAGTVVLVAGLVAVAVTRFGPRPVMAVGHRAQHRRADLVRADPGATGRMRTTCSAATSCSASASRSRSSRSRSPRSPVSRHARGRARVGAAEHGAAGRRRARRRRSRRRSRSRTSTHLLQTGDSQAAALTSGFSLAFWVIAGISRRGVVAALVLVRDESSSRSRRSRARLGCPASRAGRGLPGLAMVAPWRTLPRGGPRVSDPPRARRRDADRAARPALAAGPRADPRQARVPEPGRLGEGPDRPRDDRAGRARGEAQAGRHDRRADLGQHRRRARHRRGAARATAASSSCPTR